MDLREQNYQVKFIEACKKLRRKRYKVQVKPLTVDLARHKGGMFEWEEQEEKQPINQYNHGMVEESSPNESFYRELLSSSTRLTGDEEKDAEALNTTTEMMLTAIELAYIVEVDGTFAFFDPSDFANLYNDLEGFAVTVEDARVTSINDDRSRRINIAHLVTLAELVKPKALLMKQHGEGIFAGEMLDIRSRFRTREGRARAKHFLADTRPKRDRRVRFSGER